MGFRSPDHQKSFATPSVDPEGEGVGIRYSGTLSSHYSLGQVEGARILDLKLDMIKKQETPDTEQLVRAMIDLADWYEIFKDRKSAKAMYGEAYSMLQESSIENSGDLLRELFSPPLPQEIPVYISADHSSQAYYVEEIWPKNILGYIDVSFRVDRVGQTGKVKIVDTSPGMAEEFQIALKNDINKNMYRPHFEQGNPVRKSYIVRYYVSSVD